VRESANKKSEKVKGTSRDIGGGGNSAPMFFLAQQFFEWVSV
jgi:hypothetical protein